MSLIEPNTVTLTSVPFLLAVTAKQVGLVAAWPLIAALSLVAIGLVLATRADTLHRASDCA